MDAASTVKEGKMLPYFAFLFYSTLRPEEIADPDVRLERLQFKDFKGWEPNHEETGGVQWTFCKFLAINGKRIRLSKVKNRTPVILPTGLKWLKHHFKGVLPSEGEVYFTRYTRKKILKQAGVINWPQDAARHSLLSYARQYPGVKRCQSFLGQRCRS